MRQVHQEREGGIARVAGIDFFLDERSDRHGVDQGHIGRERRFCHELFFRIIQHPLLPVRRGGGDRTIGIAEDHHHAPIAGQFHRQWKEKFLPCVGRNKRRPRVRMSIASHAVADKMLRHRWLFSPLR